MKKLFIATIAIELLLILGGITALAFKTTDAQDMNMDTEKKVVTITMPEIKKINTYKFEGEGLDANIEICAKDIIFQENCDSPFDSQYIPANAEVIISCDEYALFADNNNYYVEDAINNVVTIAERM